MINFLIAGLLFLLSSQPALAGDDNTIASQGIVNSIEGIPNHLIINERKIFLDDDVEVMDHKEKEKSLSDIKNGKWIYMVSEEKSSGLTALRIYLLPGKVKDSEKHKYPFIVKEEDGQD